jgi:hypothetical protein
MAENCDGARPVRRLREGELGGPRLAGALSCWHAFREGLFRAPQSPRHGPGNMALQCWFAG